MVVAEVEGVVVVVEGGQAKGVGYDEVNGAEFATGWSWTTRWTRPRNAWANGGCGPWHPNAGSGTA